MSVDSGNGSPLVLARELPLLCDNKWHNISALYDSEELSIRVDQLLPWSRVRAPPGHDMPIFKGPLYIGGLPDEATSGSLVTRDNFNGCIRNVALEGKIKDWTDMDSLHNVLLGSCPVAH
ncbi:neurexin-1b-like [Ctenocephalides felis]|nr:neurexin-1b-like [Ctenocephalides felis]